MGRGCGDKSSRTLSIILLACYHRQRYNNHTSLVAPSSIHRFEVPMTQDSPMRPISRFTDFQCKDCGSNSGFKSRRRTFSERYLLPIFLLQPVRCGECFRRDYRLIFTQVSERLSDTSEMMPASRATHASHRNVA
jgi:hypothetical protein